MPEFQIDLGDMSATYAALDSFTQGYIEAAFFTESGDADRACEGKTFSDLAPETFASMIEDCFAFKLAHAALLQQAYDSEKIVYDENRAGNDFWYTRNGHGVGFWDRGLGDTGRRLTDSAHACGQVDLYVGDDGLIYA